MKCSRKTGSSRRGAVAVLVAVLLIVFFALMAFAIDVGWMYLTKAELQDAADSAALAGASQFAGGYVQYNLPGQAPQQSILSTSESTASSFAQQFSAANSAGGVCSLTLNAADIQFGFTDSNGNYTTPCSGYPNTIKVTVRRDSSANGPLELFLATVLGMSQTTMTATAAATATAGNISSFNPGLGLNSLLLPVTLDVNQWNQFMATGQSPDGNTYYGPNGAPQLQVYPSPGNAPGNFGLICPGPPASSAPQFSNWITNGPSPSDLQYLLSNGLAGASWLSPEEWAGGPGLKSYLTSAFQGIIGEPRLLPVFEPVSTSPYQAASGSGSNSYYQVVGFVGVVITSVSGNGSNMNISVQPAAVEDPTAVYDYSTVAPLGTTSSVMTTAAPAQLSQ